MKNEDKLKDLLKYIERNMKKLEKMRARIESQIKPEPEYLDDDKYIN